MVYEEKNTNSDRSYWRGTEYNHYDDFHNHKILRGRVYVWNIWAGKKKKKERESEQGREALECFALDETI